MTMPKKVRSAYNDYEEYSHKNPTKREQCIMSENGTYLESPQSKLSTLKRASYFGDDTAGRYIKREEIWYTKAGGDV